MSEPKKFYLSKYALSRGVVSCAIGGEITNYGHIYFNSHYGGYSHKYGTDIHDTAEEALEAAEKKRIKKIASLKKQIEKLEKMEFKVVEL